MLSVPLLPRLVPRCRQDGLGAILVCVALLVAACGGSSDSRTGEPTRCGISALLVPRCGALWGISTRENRDLAITEQRVGRSFDMFYRFHDIDAKIPTQFERRLAKSGTILHYSIDPRNYADGPHTTITWADVASGRYDEELRRQAEGIADLNRKVFVTFDHEPDQRDKLGRGTTADFKAAWRHVHDLFAEAGAKAVWVWVAVGSPWTFVRAARLWPGNGYVDWISWEVYNTSGCRMGRIDHTKYQSFESSMLRFYEWINMYGHSYGIDVRKPMMISEAASVIYPEDPAKTARWYEQIPHTVAKYPRIKAVTLWSSAATCNYEVTENATVTRGVAEAGRAPIFNQLPDHDRSPGP